jgi:hypothetical protein
MPMANSIWRQSDSRLLLFLLFFLTAAGWVYEPAKGRLCHLANGHTREALLHPMFQALLRNAVNWCLRREG